MAAVTLITAGNLHMASNDVAVQQWTAKCGVDIAAGNLIRFDKTTGRWVKTAGTTQANADDWFMAHSTKKAGDALTGIRGCAVDGFDLSSYSYGTPLYVSDTAGVVGDVAGTVSVVIGYVRPAYAQPRGVAPDKVLYLAAQ